MTEPLEGWALLHSKLPPAALKALPEHVYNVAGLTDVNEGYLIQRLFASKLNWQWRLLEQRYLGFEDRKSQAGKEYRVYLASVQGILEIEDREFHGAGGHDNRKLDAAFKGAATVAFKNACKLAGLTIELFKDGKAMDFIYEDKPTAHETFTQAEDARRGISATGPESPIQDQGARAGANTTGLTAPLAPASVAKTPEEILAGLREAKSARRQP